uniref:RHS repeat domain-containing protein n=1 Tax=Kordia jejudonensis TaxID=1348245 RepID=UPI00069C4A55
LSYEDLNNDGNIDVTSEIKEENNYYPFGLKQKGYNNLITGRNHNYGFGGKEENDELGLQWLDFSARNYDASLGRWMNIDPLAEEMRRHSPYNYAFNNPIFFLDPDGMKPFGSNCDDCKTKYTQTTNTEYTFIGDTPDGGVHNLRHTITQTVNEYNDDFTEVTVTTTTTKYNVQLVTSVDEDGNTSFKYSSSTMSTIVESQKFENKRSSSIFAKNGSNIRDELGKPLSRKTYNGGGLFKIGKTVNLTLEEQHTNIRGYAINLKKDLQLNRKFNPFKGDYNTNMLITGVSGSIALVVSRLKNVDPRLKLGFSIGVLGGNILRNVLSHEGRTQNLGSSKKVFWKK